jgi:hypothetical protein
MVGVITRMWKSYLQHEFRIVFLGVFKPGITHQKVTDIKNFKEDIEYFEQLAMVESPGLFVLAVTLKYIISKMLLMYFEFLCELLFHILLGINSKFISTN